jgi:ketosteroid isomerase-like protein
MKRSILLGVLGLVAVSLAVGPPPGPTESERRSVREVQELEDQFARAVVRGDRVFFKRVLADGSTHTNHSGVFKTKEQWLAEAKSGDQAATKAPATRYEGLDVDDLAIRVYGDTAVVTGRTTPRGWNAKGEPITGQYRFLRVWVRRQGQWQAVAFQGTRIAQPCPGGMPGPRSPDSMAPIPNRQGTDR